MWLIGLLLNTADRQRLVAALATVYALIAVPIQFQLTKMYGAIGLSLAMVLTPLFNFPYHYYFVLRVSSGFKMTKVILTIGVASIPIVLSSFIVKYIGVVPSMILGIIVFLIVVFVMKIITIYEMSLLIPVRAKDRSTV
jgi:hypothetical protein